MSIAYGLKAEYEGTVELDGTPVPVFSGGIIRVGERDVDVRQALDAGGGRIVVDDHDAALINRLDAHEALKRVAAHDAAVTLAPTDGMTVPALRDELRAAGWSTGGTKDELAERVQSLRAGEPQATGATTTPLEV